MVSLQCGTPLANGASTGWAERITYTTAIGTGHKISLDLPLFTEVPASNLENERLYIGLLCASILTPDF